MFGADSMGHGTSIYAAQFHGGLKTKKQSEDILISHEKKYYRTKKEHLRRLDQNWF